ncbi:MAG: glycoside hydrolase family 28 protein [Bacteroidaceae bacterium]|nr:glycoside hydrolase family 28 protein [Candidatus Minthousia equi]MCQ2245682.1 glycoside hydrolase family 28 protein [Bacteroidaceae bacterium]
MKKKNLICALLLCTASSAFSQTSVMEQAFQRADSIVNAIRQTQFKDVTYNICDFGAVANNNKVYNHEAINLAILTASQNGGGTVLVPAGDFYTGPITLKSNVNLHIAKGATLKFITDQSYYFPAVLTRWEGLDCYNAHPLIYAYGETNIAITGEGVIDGQGSDNDWWWMKGKKEHGYKAGMPSQKEGRDRLLMYAETQTPIDRRVMKPEDYLRPQLINIYRCNTVKIEGVTLKDSPFWVIHPLFVTDLIVRNVTIDGLGPNGDGCDPESCKNVLIEGCKFNTGDDCIAIKSGRNADGRKWNVPSENFIIRNCEMKNGHGGVVIGSEISGGYRNLYVENCVMDSPELERVVRIKTNTCRGGILENIFVRNITVGQCQEAVMRINTDYEQNEKCDRSFPPVVRNVNLENITCQKSDYGILINGLSQDENVYDVTVRNCTFNNVQKEGKNITGLTRNIKIENVTVNGKVLKEEKKKKAKK